MLAIITAVLGIVSTILVWSLNPKRRLYSELDGIYKQLDDLYKERDEALIKHDNDTLTIVTDSIMRLRTRKAVLLQRLG